MITSAWDRPNREVDLASRAAEVSPFEWRVLDCVARAGEEGFTLRPARARVPHLMKFASLRKAAHRLRTRGFLKAHQAAGAPLRLTLAAEGARRHRIGLDAITEDESRRILTAEPVTIDSGFTWDATPVSWTSTSVMVGKSGRSRSR